jgi:hypothetical protein
VIARRTGACLAGVSLACVPRAAEAHVKWFAAYNVAETPKGLDWVTNGTFIDLALVAIVLLTAGAVIGNMVLGRAIIASLDRVTAWMRRDTETLMRAVYGGFFVVLWTVGGIIMTPELKTPVDAISWLQLCIAACFIWRKTLVLAAAGIVFLYGYGIEYYGLFHLMDYPIFLGSAAYFALIGLGLGRRVPPVDVVRWAAAVTLMWASVEKWAYPQWTFPLFVTHAGMSLGFDPVFYMKAAGVVEFSLAFALIGPPLVRRSAAILLAATFISAVPAFGKIDAIGHSPIIVIFLAIIADNTPARERFPSFRMPAYYVVAFVITVAAYYLGHAALFPSGGA